MFKTNKFLIHNRICRDVSINGKIEPYLLPLDCIRFSSLDSHIFTISYFNNYIFIYFFILYISHFVILNFSHPQSKEIRQNEKKLFFRSGYSCRVVRHAWCLLSHESKRLRKFNHSNSLFHGQFEQSRFYYNKRRCFCHFRGIQTVKRA